MEMNENEGGMKRAKEQEAPNVDIEHKRHKLNDEEAITKVAAIPCVPSTLVLDKSQQDTIKELLQSSNVSSVQEVNSEEQKAPLIKLEEEETSTMETEILSADVTKPVTALSKDTTVNTNIGPGKNHSVTEDASITSEQLLFALTSVPPTETETVTKEEESGQVADKPTVSHRPSVSEAPVSVHPIYTAAPAVPEIKAPSPPPVLSASTPGLGITPATPPPQSPKTNPSQTTITTTNTNETNPSSSTSIPTKTSNSPLLTNATNMNLTNLPDISAALRRLSSANVSASVIEQLSSSSHLPNIGQLNSNSNNERKGSTGDVSPSEILGNALAAVAANARPMPSPKQPHQQPQLQQPSQPQNAQATATAIGNLAAITANISNFLHSGGFHRNSFSQEDTQKLAAAVAVARNTQQQQPSLGQRRKSSMAVVGNAFSNMLDQAILMGRNKSISEGTSNKPFQQPKPKLIIKNNLVWKSLEGMEEKALGFQLYSPHLLLPNLENSINGLMEIRVPARFLTFENTRVQKRALWGTDIYTDDSDIVAMAIHSGKYQPQFIEPQVEPGDPFALAVAGKQRESMEAAKRLALSGKKCMHRYDQTKPDHDLKVTVRVLPTLQHYASSIRYKLKSREWAKHDGMSLFVDKVEKIKRGDATLKGRSLLKSNMFAYETFRKQSLGLKQVLSSSNDKKPPYVQKGRIKKTPRVMRMFQIRSQMMMNKNGQDNNL